MYAKHFGLRDLPFNNTPDPRFFYPTPDHEEALATLIYAISESKGFVLLTGEVGIGKTLVSRLMLRHFQDRIAFATVNHSCESAHDLISLICAEFDISTKPNDSTTQLIHRLQNFLLGRFALNTPVVLLLDEAHNLPRDAFELLRTVGNLEADDAKLLQIVILGQPELRRRFQAADMRQLRQRLFRSFHLPALTKEQCAAYIRHRLYVAGGQNVFDEAALDAVHSASRGLPRLINTICDNAMLAAYSADRTTIDGAFMETAITQMMPAEIDRGETSEPDQAEEGCASPTTRIARTAAQTRATREAACQHDLGASLRHGVEGVQLAAVFDLQKQLSGVAARVDVMEALRDEPSRGSRPGPEPDPELPRKLRAATRKLGELGQTTGELRESVQRIAEVEQRVAASEEALAKLDQKKAETSGVVDRLGQLQDIVSGVAQRCEADVGRLDTQDAQIARCVMDIDRRTSGLEQGLAATETKAAQDAEHIERVETQAGDTQERVVEGEARLAEIVQRIEQIESCLKLLTSHYEFQAGKLDALNETAEETRRTAREALNQAVRAMGRAEQLAAVRETANGNRQPAAPHAVSSPPQSGPSGSSASGAAGEGELGPLLTRSRSSLARLRTTLDSSPDPSAAHTPAPGSPSAAVPGSVGLFARRVADLAELVGSNG